MYALRGASTGRRSIFVVRDLHHVYDGPQPLEALAGIDLYVEPGEYVAIIGANGSGKSTLARHLNALLLPARGTVHAAGLDTRDPANWPAIRRQVQMVFQRPDTQIVATVVEEDVAFGPENFGVAEDELPGRVAAALQTAGMWELRDRPAHFLSGGQKQRLAIAGALAVQPRALILDEATTMLDPAGRAAVLNLLDSLHQQGVTIVTITHEMDEAARAGRVIVLSHGRVAMDGTPLQVFGRAAEIRELGLDLPLVADLASRLGLPPCLTVPDLAAQLQGLGWRASGAPVGASAAPSEDDAACPAGPPVIQVTGLSHTYMRGTPFEVPALSDVKMTVAQCDVTGLVGQTGSGKSTLIQHFNGLLRPQTGDVVVGGDRWADPSLDVRRARRKVGLLFQQPEDQLFERYLGDDVAFGPRQWGMERAEVRSRVQAAMDAVGLPFLAFKDRLTNGLSGGERRRAAMAGVLALQPAVLVVDEPTAGLDPAGRRDVLSILRQQHAEGVTVIMASHRMEDIASLCDRVLVLANGQVVADDSVRRVLGASDSPVPPGLPVSPLAELAGALRAAGLPVPSGALTLTEIAASLERA